MTTRGTSLVVHPVHFSRRYSVLNKEDPRSFLDGRTETYDLRIDSSPTEEYRFLRPASVFTAPDPK